MPSAADNELLVRTGPDTGTGRYLRRFRIPVALAGARELAAGRPPGAEA